MARKKLTSRQRAEAASLKLYKERAEKLRRFGYDIKFGTKKRGANKAAAKSQVTRTWEKVKVFVENKRQKFVFKKISGAKRKLMEEGLSARQFTPEGYFLRIPKGTKSPKTKINVKKKTITYEYEAKNGGRLREEIHRIDPELLMEDPPRAILALGKKKDRVVLTVNGFDSSTTREYSLDSLAFYMADDLLPKFLDPNIARNDPTYARLHGKGPRDVNDFSDIFHVKILRHEKHKKRKVSRKRKTARRTGKRR